MADQSKTKLPNTARHRTPTILQMEAVECGAALDMVVTTWTADRVLLRIGHTGMRIVEKLMGLLVMVIAVQLILDGLEAYLKAVNGV